jgi:uncharacterized repeat protein (TIGR03803 family)
MKSELRLPSANPVSDVTPSTKRTREQWCACALALALALAALVPPAQAQTFSVLARFPNQTSGDNASALLFVNGNLIGTTPDGGSSRLGNIFEINSQHQESTLYTFKQSRDGRIPTSGSLIQDQEGNLYGTTQGGGGYTCIGIYTVGCGTVFKLSPTGQETILHRFSGGTDGAVPIAGLVADAAGNLYGTTQVGGSPCVYLEGCGTVYKISSTGTETVLYRFTGGTDGSVPSYGSLVIDAEGNLYGTTEQGGDLTCFFGRGCGVVFKVDPSGNETVLYSFTGGKDGGSPHAGVVRDSQGNLYGTTLSGGYLPCGNGGCGTVFKMDSSANETVLYSFKTSDNPSSGVVLDPEGNLYGTTSLGGDTGQGSVYEVTSQGAYILLHSFSNPPAFSDGLSPTVGLVRDPAGNLYGTTSGGGGGGCGYGEGCGVVFKITP